MQTRGSLRIPLQEEEALHRRIGGAHAPSHERAVPAGAALLWIHVHLRDPTSVAHLSQCDGALTPNRRHISQSPQHHTSPTRGWAGTGRGGGRPGPGSERGDGGA